MMSEEKPARKIDAQGFPVVEPPKEKTDEKERTDQAPIRRLG